ncbi:MAG: hypothetical protein K1000chlam2_01705, partial [Chlamydiae bacterium]|nr:hypothetical protein [Chlamydiota bacterium]
MGLEVKRSHFVGTQCEAENLAKHTSMHKVHQSETLCSLNTNEIKGFVKKGYEKVKDFFSWLYEKAKAAFQKIFSCFPCIAQKSLLESFKRDL